MFLQLIASRYEQVSVMVTSKWRSPTKTSQPR
ncbi:hypothetical protein ACFCXT_00050 [Streptomyces vinaceus]